MADLFEEPGAVRTPSGVGRGVFPPRPMGVAIRAKAVARRSVSGGATAAGMPARMLFQGVATPSAAR